MQPLILAAEPAVTPTDDTTQDSDPDDGDKCEQRRSYCESILYDACINAAFSESQCNDRFPASPVIVSSVSVAQESLCGPVPFPVDYP